MLLEGGNFHCDTTGFDTEDVNAWNEHCLDPNHPNPIHMEQGNTNCVDCNLPIQYSDVPYHPYDSLGSKNIRLRCGDCQVLLTTGNITRSLDK